MTAQLECRQLNKTLGGKRVLADLNLDVREGEVVSLLGASGSGKTTLLRMISGLLNPDSGSISIGGTVVWSERETVSPENRRIGMVFQDYALWPHMTVAGNLGFGLTARGLSAQQAADRIAHALELTQLGALADRYPSELSGGQQQRVAIARCLAARPRLMLFDEPLSNLDAALRDDLRTDMMRLVREAGTTVVYVTHDQAEAMAVSDRIAVMRSGVITQFDTPKKIYDAPATAFVASFIGGFSLLPGKAGNGIFRPALATETQLGTHSALSGDAMLVIRPEDAQPASVYPENRLTGTVAIRAFQGRCWRLVVDIGSHKIRLDWPDAPSIGETLAFSLSPERCTLVAP
jgi:ABC-type Fe3+/spermidine/putrescine transport system ATPase subunit